MPAEPVVDPRKVTRNRDILERAKARTPDRPKDLEDVRRFDEHPVGWRPEEGSGDPSRPPPKKTLSRDTVEGLKQFSAANPPPKEEVEEEVDADADVTKSASTWSPPVPEKTDDQKLREAIEARLGAFDIGQYLFTGGEMTQKVPIVPGKLEVTFRLVTDAEEVFVDSQLRLENDGIKGGLADREMYRRLNEWSLASHIHSINGQAWGPTIDNTGKVDEKAMANRFAKVRKLPSPVVTIISQNLAWFVDRANKSLTFEALKNG